MKKIIKIAVVWLLLLPLYLISNSLTQMKTIWNTSPKKINLENNLTLIYENDKSSKTSVVQIFIRGGRRADLKDKEGLAYLTTRLSIEYQTKAKYKK